MSMSGLKDRLRRSLAASFGAGSADGSDAGPAGAVVMQGPLWKKNRRSKFAGHKWVWRYCVLRDDGSFVYYRAEPGDLDAAAPRPDGVVAEDVAQCRVELGADSAVAAANGVHVAHSLHVQRPDSTLGSWGDGSTLLGARGPAAARDHRAWTEALRGAGPEVGPALGALYPVEEEEGEGTEEGAAPRELEYACPSGDLWACDESAAAPRPARSVTRRLSIELEFHEEDCEVTPARLLECERRATVCDTAQLTREERKMLSKEQQVIRKTLKVGVASEPSIKRLMQSVAAEALPESEQGEEKISEEESSDEESSDDDMEEFLEVVEETVIEAPPQAMDRNGSARQNGDDDGRGDSAADLPQASDQGAPEVCLLTSKDMFQKLHINLQLRQAKERARQDKKNDGVLGVQSTKRTARTSVMNGNYLMYNLRRSSMTGTGPGLPPELELEGEKADDDNRMDVEDVSYVRKPRMEQIVEQYQAMQNHPKYTLRQVVLSRRFHLYMHRFGNAQYARTLHHPTLPQPQELLCADPEHPWLCGVCREEDEDTSREPPTEQQRTRAAGHRFAIAADTQFGILMDGFAMERPNWSQEIEISRRCVAQLNALEGRERPLYVCVCGDLVDTESSFSGAIASWKKVMKGWERNLVFEQQVKDFKRVWAELDHDIALVCMCGNHDVGNRPTRASISRWTTAFGDEYLSFWANGSFNICLNNCLFSNPDGAEDMFAEQLKWLEEKLAYGRERDATHIFIYGHFPWFLKHEEEGALTSTSKAPKGWGPVGSKFPDSYFTIPYERRKIAMALFRKYNVTACFSGHFHQNVVAQSSWGMPMIVTGPLSMNLFSTDGEELSKGEPNGLGMRLVDVQERGEFTHKWLLLDHEEELYDHAIQRCLDRDASLLDIESETSEMARE